MPLSPHTTTFSSLTPPDNIHDPEAWRKTGVHCIQGGGQPDRTRANHYFFVSHVLRLYQNECAQHQTEHLEDVINALKDAPCAGYVDYLRGLAHFLGFDSLTKSFVLSWRYIRISADGGYFPARDLINQSPLEL